MFNYKRTKKPNSRYSSEEYMPKIIEKMYNLGKSFSYEQDYPKMNYSLKINRLKISAKELNNEIKLYRQDLDSFLIENNSMESQLNNNYNKLKNELNNNIHIIKNKIDDKSSEQNKFYSKIEDEFEEMKRADIDIKKLINDFSERINKIKKKLNENNQKRSINDYKENF